RRTRRPYSASAAPRLIVVVVLPTPPFWLQTATIRAGPCSSRGSGSGKTGTGRCVGPSPLLGSVSMVAEDRTPSALSVLVTRSLPGGPEMPSRTATLGPRIPALKPTRDERSD